MRKCEERRWLRASIGALDCHREAGHYGIHRDNGENLYWFPGAPPPGNDQPSPGREWSMSGYVDVNGIARSDLDKVTPAESQAWVRFRVAAALHRAAYIGEYDRTIVGEDERGDILAPVPGSSDMWELFDVTKAEHRAAAAESARRGVVAYLELE